MGRITIAVVSVSRSRPTASPFGAGVASEELMLARIERHSGRLDELDVEGILAFAERVLPRAADLWVQASLEQRQRFQQLFCTDGSRRRKSLCWNAVTAAAFSYLRWNEAGNEGLVMSGIVGTSSSPGFSESIGCDSDKAGEKPRPTRETRDDTRACRAQAYLLLAVVQPEHRRRDRDKWDRASWNRLTGWLASVDALRLVA